MSIDLTTKLGTCFWEQGDKGARDRKEHDVLAGSEVGHVGCLELVEGIEE